mmetsp:Transcript_23949/g.95036  ORF Transcript_23949/g.95036 Transcript_23949/m.95036 type:complete len:201 (+) Transcript_23949:287-889(+)
MSRDSFLATRSASTTSCRSSRSSTSSPTSRWPRSATRASIASPSGWRSSGTRSGTSSCAGRDFPASRCGVCRWCGSSISCWGTTRDDVSCRLRAMTSACAASRDVPEHGLASRWRRASRWPSRRPRRVASRRRASSSSSKTSGSRGCRWPCASPGKKTCGHRHHRVRQQHSRQQPTEPPMWCPPLLLEEVDTPVSGAHRR